MVRWVVSFEGGAVQERSRGGEGGREGNRRGQGEGRAGGDGSLLQLPRGFGLLRVPSREGRGTRWEGEGDGFQRRIA